MRMIKLICVNKCYENTFFINNNTTLLNKGTIVNINIISYKYSKDTIPIRDLNNNFLELEEYRNNKLNIILNEKN